jgi:2-methylcitrate dehydratase PrpD
MPTRKLSEFVCNTSYNDIPADVIEHSKLVFLDWLGVDPGRLHEEDGLRYGGYDY